MSKSFCRGKYLKRNIIILNQCVCCDYYYSEIGRVMASKGHKSKQILRAVNAVRISNKRFGIKNSFANYIKDDFIRVLDPNKKYILYVNKAGGKTEFDVFDVEDAKKKGMLTKKRR